MSNFQEQLTLFIPTRNRPHFLRMALEYYREIGWPYSIFIADASDPEMFAQTAACLKTLPSLRAVEHRLFPADIGVHTSWLQVLEEIQTPYVIYAGDDDFLIPSAMQRCIDFLETHNDYTLASGFALRPTVRQKEDGSYEILSMESGIFKSIEDESPVNRLLKCFYPTWAPNEQALQRTSQIRETFRSAIGRGLDVNRESELFCECAINGTNVIKGKEKKMGEFLSLVMLKHGQQLYRSQCINTFRRFISPHFPKTAETVVDWWRQELIAKNVSAEEAARTAEAVFMYLIHQKCLSGLRDILQPMVADSARSRLARLPFARKIWQSLKPARYKITMPALLSETSAYHDDFIKVYQRLSAPASGRGLS